MDYCNKEELKELLKKYNIMNYTDDGNWIDRYLQRMHTKKNKKALSDLKFDNALSFAERKRKQVQETRENWNNLTHEERMVYNSEFAKVTEELTNNFIKIIDGRIQSYRLWQHEDVEDIKQEALLALYKYVNRFDYDSNTSAFAYVTQIINNAFNLYLQKYNDHADKEICGLTFYDNMGNEEDEDI